MIPLLISFCTERRAEEKDLTDYTVKLNSFLFLNNIYLFTITHFLMVPQDLKEIYSVTVGRGGKNKALNIWL